MTIERDRTVGGGSAPRQPARLDPAGSRARRGRAGKSAAAARRAEKSGSWRSTLFVAVTLGFALVGLAPLLQGFTWWLQVMAMVVTLLAVMAFVRGRGAPEVLVVAVAAIVWGGLVMLLYAASTLWLVFPTIGTIADISLDLSAARESIAVQEVPAIADAPITQLIVMSVGLIAIVADELATGLRAPVLSGVGPLAVIAISPLVRRNDADVVVYVLTAASFLLVIWFSSRIGRRAGGRRETAARTATGRNPALALGIGAASIVTMLALPAVTPGLTADSLTDDSAGNLFPSVYASGIDPTIQLGRDLRRSDPVLSLTYSTTSEEGLYLRMVSLGDFSTGTWEPEEPLNSRGYDGQEFGTPPGLAPDVPIVESETSVSIAALRSDWLPLPYPAQRVGGLDGSWLLSPTTFTMTDLRGDTRGVNYEITGLSIEPTPGQLAEAGAVVPDAVRDYLDLPEGLPPVIAETAAAVTDGAATNYDRAVALQEYFRSDQFDYSLAAPVEGDFDGDNADAIAAFLEVKSGYCVHFSASMAVMARTLGIPSRIAVGYAPGQSADATTAGRPVYEVYTDQLHAWPELYFDGIGWLPFEPTPGLDITPPDYSLPDYAQSAGPAAALPTPSSTSSIAESQQRAEDAGAIGGQSPEQIALGQLRGWAVFVAVVGGIALVVVAPWGIRSLIRRNRVRRLVHDPLPATLAWTELEDTLDDHRVERAGGDTVFDLERRLNDERVLPPESLDRLRRQVEQEQYASPGHTDEEQRLQIESDLRALIAALQGGAPSGERLKARLLPASLWRRRRSTSATRPLVP